MYGIKWLPCRRCDELSCSTRLSYSLPLKFTVFKTKLLQMFSMVFFSTPTYTYIYRHTVTRASSHDCWIYVYAEGYICIVAFFPFCCSSLPFECHWYMHCSYSVWHYSCSFASGQNQPSHCQNGQQYLCLSCAVFRMKWQIARPSCCPSGESRAQLHSSPAAVARARLVQDEQLSDLHFCLYQNV